MNSGLSKIRSLHTYVCLFVFLNGIVYMDVLSPSMRLSNNICLNDITKSFGIVCILRLLILFQLLVLCTFLFPPKALDFLEPQIKTPPRQKWIQK